MTPTGPAVPAVLVLGTGNRKKAGELAELLAPSGLRLLSLADFPDAVDVAETGQSFADNARLKATRQATHLGQWVLGDDSGLEADALGGAPGIYSARYAGAHATDADNRHRLLEALRDVPPERRGAQFVCHLTLADPLGAIRAESTGCCRGCIRREEAGFGGFGYDPLFEVVEYHRTFGELGPAAKGCLSHRARAVQAMLEQIGMLAWK